MNTRVIVPAAGVGSRLSSHTQAIPKCLIKVGETTIATRALDILRSRGIQDVLYVLGHQASAVEIELGSQVRYLFNPFYKVSNSIASLWLAREALSTDQDVIIMNADVFFDPQVLDRLLDAEKPFTMLCDRTRIAEADYRLGLEGDRIVRFGKELTDGQTDAEYVGIARLQGPAVKAFADRLDCMVRHGQLHAWWEDVLFDLSKEGNPLFACDVAGLFWGEIDCAADWKRLLTGE
jgi:choline kinase